MQKTEVIYDALASISRNDLAHGSDILNKEYPFKPFETATRNYTIRQKMAQFIADGFIDIYSGDRLVNPGALKVLSAFYPKEFPYQAHWKTTETHIAYWELIPTIDHIVPISLGGVDSKENWATTSMMHNSIKNNWTLDQLQWKIYPKGDIQEWDGLTQLFVEVVSHNEYLLKDNYIKDWYRISKDLKI